MPIRVREMIAALILAESAFFARLLVFFPESGWYSQLKKPYLAPPDRFYLAAWALAFACIGLGSFFFWREGNETADISLGVRCYMATLVTSVFWAFVFFDLHSLGWALIVSCAMLFLATETLISFGKVSSRAGFLVIPFIAWFLFGAFLTYGYWLVN